MRRIVNPTSVLSNAPTWRVHLFLFACAFVLYWRTMPPTVLDGDNAEFQYMAFILGIPHSTGYPLYILLAKLFTFLPIGDVAYRVTLFSVVCGALTAPIFFSIARRVVSQTFPALCATLVLIVAPSMWGGAIETKTYALHLFLGALAILFALRWHQNGNARDFYWLAFIVGLGLTNHPVFRFLAIPFALVAWFNRARLNRAMVMKGILLGLLPLFLYAYIPIRANQLIAQQDPQNWALYTREDAMLKGTITAYYNNTVAGFFNLISGLDNSYKLGFTSPLEQANRFELAATLLWQQFGLIGIGLALVGARASFRSERKIFAILLAVAMAMGFIALYLRGISTVYYFSLTYLVLALWIGFGIKTFLESAERLRVNFPARLTWLTTTQTMRAIFLCVPLATLATNFSNLDQSNFFSAREYARAALNDQLAPNAVVIAPWEISQPMRYLQFVENVRPDVLVVNVSPVMKQFETMRANAYELKRPFYLAQFVPENQNALTLRAVQAIPLPMRAIPQPHYVVNKKIVNEIEIIGYDLEPDPPLPGQSARVLIYYRALARVYPIYSAIFSVNDITGHPWGNQDSFPGSFYFPTYRWQVGNVFRDAFPLNLPPDAPSGLYALDLSWYVYDLDTNKRDESREFATALGTIRVGDIPSTALIAQKTNAQSENGIALVGWNAAPALNSNFISVARGETIQLDLFWRAARGQQNNFTVFVHLLDSAGRVVSDADSPPSRGVYPTDRWNSGEIFRDRHALIIPRELAPGDYSIEVGMYLPATNQRVLFDRGDKILLGTVRVR